MLALRDALLPRRWMPLKTDIVDGDRLYVSHRLSRRGSRTIKGSLERPSARCSREQSVMAIVVHLRVQTRTKALPLLRPKPNMTAVTAVDVRLQPARAREGCSVDLCHQQVSSALEGESQVARESPERRPGRVAAEGVSRICRRTVGWWRFGETWP